MRLAIIVCVTSGGGETQKKLGEKDSVFRLVYVGALGGGADANVKGDAITGNGVRRAPRLGQTL